MGLGRTGRPAPAVRRSACSRTLRRPYALAPGRVSFALATDTGAPKMVCTISVTPPILGRF